MTGMNRTTGRGLDGLAHLSQSVMDILMTPRGTRLMRRDYGSDLPALLDAPINGQTVVDLYAACAEALDRWEPRLRLERVQLDAAEAGRATLRLTGLLIDGRRIDLPLTLDAVTP